jgi:uncharacterized protein (DUF305 family)
MNIERWTKPKNSLIQSVLHHHQRAVELDETGINVSAISDIGTSVYTEQPRETD